MTSLSQRKYKLEEMDQQKPIISYLTKPDNPKELIFQIKMKDGREENISHYDIHVETLRSETFSEWVQQHTPYVNFKEWETALQKEGKGKDKNKDKVKDINIILNYKVRCNINWDVNVDRKAYEPKRSHVYTAHLKNGFKSVIKSSDLCGALYLSGCGDEYPVCYIIILYIYISKQNYGISQHLYIICIIYLTIFLCNYVYANSHNNNNNNNNNYYNAKIYI